MSKYQLLISFLGLIFLFSCENPTNKEELLEEQIHAGKGYDYKSKVKGDYQQKSIINTPISSLDSLKKDTRFDLNAFLDKGEPGKVSEETLNRVKRNLMNFDSFISTLITSLSSARSSSVFRIKLLKDGPITPIDANFLWDSFVPELLDKMISFDNASIHNDQAKALKASASIIIIVGNLEKQENYIKEEQQVATEIHKTYNEKILILDELWTCLLYTSPSPRDLSTSRMPSSA